MSLILRMAWRNIWRHPRRVGLTLAAIVFSDIILVWMMGLQLGQYDLMIENTLNTFTGQVQIQQQQYQDKPNLRHSIKNAGALAEKVRQALGSDKVAVRAQAFALISSQQRSFGALITGVQPEFESKISRLPGMLIKGEYLTSDDRDVAVIGSVLAKNLKIKLGDEITMLGSAKDGSVAASIFKVKGIINSKMQALDRSMIQIPLAMFQEVFFLGNEANAIVINSGALENIPAELDLLNKQLSKLSAQKDLRILDWEQLEPGLKQAIQSDYASGWFMYSILVLIVGFSVLNTFLMSVLERTHEFGVMLSLGLTPGRIGAWVLWESSLLAFLGMCLGIVLGLLVTWYSTFHGITYPGSEEMAKQFNMSTTMYPDISPTSVFLGPTVIFVATLLAALYPALRLRQLRPLEAMNAV